MSRDGSGNIVVGAKFSLPGDVQTVPRAELFCAVYLVNRASSGVDIEYITDNKGLANIFNKGPMAAKTSTNCDLFDDIFSITRDKAIR